MRSCRIGKCTSFGQESARCLRGLCIIDMLIDSNTATQHIKNCSILKGNAVRLDCTVSLPFQLLPHERGRICKDPRHISAVQGSEAPVSVCLA